jgi:hypothetical protein
MATSIPHHSSCSLHPSTNEFTRARDCVTDRYPRLLLPNAQLESASKITSDLTSVLSRCPSDFYLLIRQPGVGAADFSTSSSSPTLSKFLGQSSHSTSRSIQIVPEVAGKVDMKSLAKQIERKCGASSTTIDASGT